MNASAHHPHPPTLARPRPCVEAGAQAGAHIRGQVTILLWETFGELWGQLGRVHAGKQT